MKQILILLSFIFCFSFMGCHEHEWESVDCKTPITCKTCGKTKEEMGPHSWEENVIVKAATCEEDGLETRKCSICEISEDIVVNKLGHVFEDVKVLKQATCESIGSKRIKCNRCKITKDVDVEKLPHEYVDYFCKNCGYENRPYSIDLTYSEQSKTNKVKYISSVNCEYKSGKLSFYYCLMDDKKEEIIVPTYAKIIIKDKWGEIKYKGYKRVNDSGTLSSIIGGTKLINMTTISPLYLFPNDWGQLGTLEYEVYSPGKWNFDKDIIDIY
jgi:hypothetical protein